MKNILTSLRGESIFQVQCHWIFSVNFTPGNLSSEVWKHLKKQLSPYCISNVIIHQPIFPIFFNLKCRQHLFFHTDYKPRLNKMGLIQASISKKTVMRNTSQGPSLKEVTEAATEALVTKVILRFTNTVNENPGNIPDSKGSQPRPLG